MVKKSKHAVGDDTPVTGGIDLAHGLTRQLPADVDLPTEDLGQQAYWLLKLNADKIALKFRQSDLSAMDDATKQQLIADIRDSLGVKPFVKAVI